MNKLEKDQIEIKIIPSTEYILNGIVNKLYMLFEFHVKKEYQKGEERTPMELALVLDRSGSMSGSKIENSKLAIQKIIENLRFDDKLHFVTYDSDVDTVFKDGQITLKDSLIKNVSKIQPGGMTNLSEGVIRGQSLIDLNRENKKSKRIFLFSDGLANEGITSLDGVSKLIQDIHKKGINISSFGIGDDFSEEMMQAIAEYGAGDYFFIDTADQIPKIVSEGLDGLLSIVSSNNLLHIRGINGAIVTKIYTHDLQKGAILGDLRDGEMRQVLVELNVNPSNLKEGEPILECSLKYNPIDDLLTTKTYKIQYSMKTTDNEELIMEENKEVLVMRKLLEASDIEDRTIELMKDGKYDASIKVQKTLISDLKNLSNVDTKGIVQDKLENAIKNLKNMEEGIEMNDMSVSMKQAHYSSYTQRRSKKRRK